MIDILICDNNARQAEQLRAMLAELLPEPAEIAVCGSADALRAACAKRQPQIVLLDVLLGQDNGIELAQTLFPQRSGTAVIFISGYPEYALDAYAAEHVWFLTKPVDRLRLDEALRKALALPRQEQAHFFVTVDRAPRRIALCDVMSIESSYRKLRIALPGETVECYGTFAALPEALRSGMIQCHKSYLVSPQYIQTIRGSAFLLTSGASVPISRNRYAESRRAFLAYCSRKTG